MGEERESVCCVWCVCMRERERQGHNLRYGGNDKKKERKRESERMRKMEKEDAAYL